MTEGTAEKYEQYLDRLATTMLAVAEDTSKSVPDRVQAANALGRAYRLYLEKDLLNETKNLLGDHDHLGRQVEDIKRRRQERGTD